MDVQRPTAGEELARLRQSWTWWAETSIVGDDPDCYHGYFENEYGEQAVFVYNGRTKTARLWQGDAGWEEPCDVVDGRAEGRILTPSELLWLKAVWQAATGCGRRLR